MKVIAWLVIGWLLTAWLVFGQTWSEVWETQLPAGVRPAAVFVDGRRAQVARTPNGEAWETGLVMPSNQWGRVVTTPRPVAGDAELVTLVEWMEYRARASFATNRTGNTLYFPTNTMPWLAKAPYLWQRIGQIPFATIGGESDFDAPGEWHLSATGRLRYRPLPGQTLADTRIDVPTTNQLLRLVGVTNLVVNGQRFAVTDWDCSAAGWFAPSQAAFAGSWNNYRPPPAAVELVHCVNVTFTNCVFEMLGGTGIRLGDGVKGCAVVDSTFREIGANAIEVGSWRDRNGGNANNRIADCRVERVGQTQAGSVGVWLGFTSGTIVSNVTVRDVPYTGISIGWAWNANPTDAMSNTVVECWIERAVTLLGDGGGIYALGNQPGSRIADNTIRAIRRRTGAAQANGMFFDQGATSYLVTGNRLRDILDAPIRFNQAGANEFAENVFERVVP